MSLSRYSAYREINVPWMLRLPDHWGVHQTKRHFRRLKEVNKGMACENRLALTMNGVVPRSLDDLDGLQSNDYEGYQIFESGDLAFKLIDLQNIKTSRVGLVPERGIMSPAYIRLRPLDGINARFGYWYFMALYWTQVFNALGGGVRQTLGPEELLTVEFPVPPPVEQTAIAAFLDRETAKIDALIAEQEKLIALLAEKRQATISHAVTRGLNPDAPMKDSGLPWLGEVPAHWIICPIKTLGQLKGGSGFPENQQGIDGEELGFYKVASLGRADRYGVLKPADDTVSKATALNLGAYLFPKYSIVFAKVGAALLLGRLRELPAPSCIDNNMMGMVVNNSNNVTFLRYSMNLIRFDLIANPGAVPSINNGQIGNYLLAKPPLDEQIAIATFLNEEMAKLNDLELEVERNTELLKERRSALITAAVTGQIDVRGLA